MPGLTKAEMEAAEAALAKREKPKWKKWHRVVQQVGQSYEEALATYGADRIGPDDGIIQRELVRPQFDAQGRIIPRQG